MRLLSQLARDESGLILSAEAALLGTGAVLASVVGVNLLGSTVNDELRDVAYSFRSLDQSYSVAGHYGPTAWVAGSGFTQRPVCESLAELRDEECRLRQCQQNLEDAGRSGGVHGHDGHRHRSGDDAARGSRDGAGSSRSRRDAGSRDRDDAKRDADADRDVAAWERNRDWE